LALVQEQLTQIEREFVETPTPCKETEKKRRQLLHLKAIGPIVSAVMAREVYCRKFDNRR